MQAPPAGLSPSEWQHACQRLGREPNPTEIGVIGVMWSEHCSYKSSRRHLKGLPTDGPQVVQGPGENAGAVDIGDGYCAVFKMESHNHPSFIEPYQGAATGVGGILRDVFTMGARPIALLNSLRFGSPGHHRTPHLLRGVVAGIGDYGNCMGVPTVGGELQFDSRYDGNILVNAFALGIAHQGGLFFGRADTPGNAVVYVGSRTGRDGIHGATMASAAFAGNEDDGHSASAQKLPTIQVGDPFIEKLLLEACLEIFASGCVQGVQDMGAAGLTSSAVEMAARGGQGLELDLDAVPRRARNLSAYEMLLSESQERMLMVASPEGLQALFAICEKWDLDAAIIGKVTDTGRFVCRATQGYDPFDPACAVARDPSVVVDLPIGLLANEAPAYDRPRAPAPNPPALSAAESSNLQRMESPEDELLRCLSDPDLGSRAWVWQQFDHIVGNGTVLGPGKSDAAVLRVVCDRERGTPIKALAVAVDGNGRWVELDARKGAQMVVAECARNIVCSGARPLGLTDCLNFGDPERPEVMEVFASAIEGLADACRALGLPVVSGNVSLYNDTDGRAILPTPTVAIVGQLDDLAHRLPSAFQQQGDAVALLGFGHDPALGGSAWATHRTGDVRKTGILPDFDLEEERRLHALMRALATRQLLRSAHDSSEGGLAVCLAECCIDKGFGAKIAFEPLPEVPLAGHLFGEAQSRIVVSFDPSHQARIGALAQEHGVPLRGLGSVEGSHLDWCRVLSISVVDLRQAHASALNGIVDSDDQGTGHR